MCTNFSYLGTHLVRLYVFFLQIGLNGHALPRRAQLSTRFCSNKHHRFQIVSGVTHKLDGAIVTTLNAGIWRRAVLAHLLYTRHIHVKSPPQSLGASTAIRLIRCASVSVACRGSGPNSLDSLALLLFYTAAVVRRRSEQPCSTYSFPRPPHRQNACAQERPGQASSHVGRLTWRSLIKYLLGVQG